MPVPVIVLNFGHSVLRSLDDYTQAASEIYRHYRQGQNVVAVTSAQGDQTDMLMAEARQIGPEGAAKNLPELIQLGERRSAALLALALERVGAPAFVRQARDLGLKARNATLVDLDVEQLEDDLKNHDIVVMPGHVAIGEKDRTVLLTEGGSDMTAIYVAKRLGIKAKLLKDVEGVFDKDPKSAGAEPKRYDQISYADARAKAGPLVSPKALDFAEEHAIEFDIGKPGIPSYTTIGANTGSLSAIPEPKKLRVAMLGCGIVGGGVYRRVKANNDRFEMVKIMVRNPAKYIDQGYKSEELTTDIDNVIAAKPDIFIDVSGPVEPCLSYCKTMLENGVHVVSANKQAIAAGGQELLDLAKEKGTQLMFSSAAGGGMPLEMCIRERGRITRVEALLNGTTNYMLDEISAGKSYAEALKEAQDKGFAEADPSGDVNGSDAAAKIRLVALLGFGEEVTLDDIPRDTIENFAPNSPPKGAMKRIATCWKDMNGFSTKLELKDLSLNNFIAQADGEEAHAIFYFDDGDQYRIRGKGAGRWPTTESVMADLFDISATYF